MEYSHSDGGFDETQFQLLQSYKFFHTMTTRHTVLWTCQKRQLAIILLKSFQILILAAISSLLFGLLCAELRGKPAGNLCEPKLQCRGGVNQGWVTSNNCLVVIDVLERLFYFKNVLKFLEVVLYLLSLILLSFCPQERNMFGWTQNQPDTGLP